MPAATHAQTPPEVIGFRAGFTLPASPQQVWSSLGRFDRYEEWWPWLSELRADGSGVEVGRVLDGLVAPPLPYRMRVRVTLVECTRPRMIRAAVGGDLHGHAGLVLTSVPGGTRAEVDWTIEMMQTPLRLVSRFARPVLLWGHDRVVDATVAGFCRYLEGRIGARGLTAGHRRAAPRGHVEPGLRAPARRPRRGDG